ncbi:MAG: urease subunit beta [Pseudomonadota bacterium]
MMLTPTERDRLTIFTAAELARRYRGLGIRLSQPEATALITDEILTAARRDLPYQDVLEVGRSCLTTDDVEPGVATLIPFVSVEVSLAEGTKLVTVFDPITPGSEPVENVFVPGEVLTPDDDIEVNQGRDRIEIDVINTGDRTIQVRSHAHFFEVNRALAFDRKAAYGRRLDAPSGVGARFDPGVAKRIGLVPFAGSRRVHGFAGLVEGLADDETLKMRALEEARMRGYKGA